MKILLLPRYESLAASSRYRFYQYIPFLKNEGWDIVVKPLLCNNYVKYLYDRTPFPLTNIIRNYFERVFQLLKNKEYDLIWLQQELFPWIPAFFENIFSYRNSKIISDYDDAFFHRYDKNENLLLRALLRNKIDSVMNYSDLVLAGSNYLLERAELNNNRVKLFPTVVDTDKFRNSHPKKNDRFTIGWIGSPGTSGYLNIIKEALLEVSRDREITINLIGAKNLQKSNLPFNFIEWSELTEVEEISKFDLGIMPLPDDPWERGKCGFKLIQYLSCNIPVLGSPVGANKDIIVNGVNGFQPNNKEEWVYYIKKIKDNKELSIRMGNNGRKLVEEKYSLQKNAIKLVDCFKELSRI